MSFLQDKVNVYDDLIRLHLERADADSLWAAFQIAESAKSRTLADLLTGVVTREAKGTAEDDWLDELQADLSAAYNRIFEANGLEAEDQQALQQRLDHVGRLEGEISQLRLRQASQASPDALAAPVPLEALQGEIGQDRPMLCYHLVQDEILAFFIAGGSIRVLREIGRVHVVQTLLQRLAAQWDRFRAGREFVERNQELLERSARRVLHDLYGELFAAVDDELGSDGLPASLTVIPHGILHQIPFHALFDGQAYLLDRVEIGYAPSAAVYSLCARRGGGAPRRGLAAGLADALIPAAESEAGVVGRQLIDFGVAVDVLTGQAATRSQFRRLAETSDVIHLACHGLFRSDNPMFSALKLADGWLTAADVMTYRLQDPFVVLSACESGKSRVIPGDEVIGFSRAFFGAGAASMLISLWLVQDETTTTLMESIYRQIGAGMGKARALRYAQQRLRETHPHPYYWAPFVLTGRG
jgi:CHAT domain-containing protein